MWYFILILMHMPRHFVYRLTCFMQNLRSDSVLREMETTKLVQPYKYKTLCSMSSKSAETKCIMFLNRKGLPITLLGVSDYKGLKGNCLNPFKTGGLATLKI